MTKLHKIEWIMLVVAVAAVLAMPLKFGFIGPVPNTTLKICIYIIMALGLNVVMGYTGQLDLGYVTFMATGMVIAAVAAVSVHLPAEELAGLGPDRFVDVFGWFQIPIGGASIGEAARPFHFPGGIWLMLILAGVVCAALGVVRGLPTLHLTGDYYAIVTLGIAEIVYIYYRAASWTGGAMSLTLTVDSTPSFLGDKLYPDTARFYYLTVFVLTLAIVGSVFIRESRLGRALAAIRLDSTAAETCGIPVNRYKMIAFAVSGFVGGVGGALYTLLNGQFSAAAVEVWESILLVCILVLGGIGSVRGAILAAIVLVALGEVFREPMPNLSLETGRLYWEPWPQQARMLFYGVILIVLMRFRPKGVFPDRLDRAPLSAGETETMRVTDTPLFQIGNGHGSAPASDTQSEGNAS